LKDDIYLKILAHKLEERNPFAALGVEEITVLRLILKEYKEHFCSCGKG
jgi:hypothetical protein